MHSTLWHTASSAACHCTLFWRVPSGRLAIHGINVSCFLAECHNFDIAYSIAVFFQLFSLQWNHFDHLDCSRNLMQRHNGLFCASWTETSFSYRHKKNSDWHRRIYVTRCNCGVWRLCYVQPPPTLPSQYFSESFQSFVSSWWVADLVKFSSCLTAVVYVIRIVIIIIITQQLVGRHITQRMSLTVTTFKHASAADVSYQ